MNKKDKIVGKKKKSSFHESWIFLVVICLVVPVLFRSLFFAPFHIPSGSMKPTLLIGDFIFVSKFSYGYGRYSFPLGGHFFKGRLRNSAPKRGDIVVFRPTPSPHLDYIKRLIGLPGDIIQVKDGRLYINNILIPQERIEDFTEEDSGGSVKRYRQYIETLPNGVSHRVLDETSTGMLDNTEVFKIPAGNYFFMGDNRDNSADSRDISKVGLVPEENLIGRAEVIALSTSDNLWKVWEWFYTLRYNRFWKKLTNG